MENLNFSEEEIHQQLDALGYKNIAKHRLRQFKQDLDQLVQRGEFQTVEVNVLKPQQSPPAFTKEKVGRCYLDVSGDAFFLHAKKADHHRQVLNACQKRDGGRLQGSWDSYAQNSVSVNVRPPPDSSSSRLQEEQPDPDQTLHPALSPSTTTPDSHSRRFIKRKVLRKHEGQSLICDESIYSEDDAVDSLDERLADVHFTPPDSESEDTSQSHSDSDGASLSAFQSYLRGITRSRSDGDLRPKPKSFIRPVMNQQTRRTDPVAKYHQYKQLWETFKLPGESDRREIRWEIQEQLAYRPPPPKPRRVFVPNTYTVPTEKKRSALRWEIRNDLANGFLPRTQRF